MTESSSTDQLMTPGDRTVGPAKPTTPAMGDRENDAKVASLFTVLDDEHLYVAYDPDALCREVLAVADDHDVPAEPTVDEIATLTKRVTGIEFPDLVQTRAEIAVQDEYVASEVTVLLHLIRAHGELIREGKIASTGTIPHHVMAIETKDNRTFNTVCTLRLRTQEAMRHLGNAAKHAVTRSKSTAKELLTREQSD